MIQKELFEIELLHIDGETKTCSKCNERLPLTAFSVSSGANFLRPECKKCNNELTKVRNQLREKHGMPNSDYTCPVCERGETEVAGKGGQKNGAWVLDHCHDTSTFRGWLCHSCNRALGGFSDSVDILKKAIIYLEKHMEKINETNT
tara:strand:+ start:3820 stop:4260 length:441 start_codon:yes stop_codon:yes gene_type:complete